jgi:DNA-binding NarL/FixJ family response regulator
VALSISVAIIEDDPAVRKILVSWMSRTSDFCCVGEYGNVQSAVARMPGQKPDVALVDINLLGQNGISGVRQLKPLLPGTQFLMLTVYEDGDHIFDALTAGAAGYLLKRTPRDELLSAIKQVHEGGSPMTSYIARKVVRWFQKAPSPKHEPEGLSPRESEVLRLLARGYAYKEIAETLGISLPTVNTHIHRIYQKLHVRSRGEAIALVAQVPVGPQAPSGPYS